MMSNTRARLAPAGRPGGTERGELIVAEAVERGLPGPLLADDPAQDGSRDDDRAEHRDEDADDQDEREATDDRRPERVQDGRRDEARHVRVEDGVPGAVKARLDGRRERLADAQLFLHPL